MTFSETGLRSEILSAIADLGFENPTAIQEQTIPHILTSDRDLVALAQTGTGKTAAFGLPLLHRMEEGERKIQAMVLAPTRELCVQIAKDIMEFAKHMDGLKVATVYGGASYDTQKRALRAKPQVVVGTPGRTLDLINGGDLDVSAIRFLVLDEADEMLKMGFKDEMDAILAETPSERQTLLFSATMPDEIRGMTARYMREPLEISVGQRNTGNKDVEHWFYVVKPSNRYEALKRIADLHPDIYGIIFCRTRLETQEIATKLIEDHYSADSLHGDLSQAQRDHVMNRFRNGQLQLLVATDVAARGLDVDNLTHIINYNLPDKLENYIHRSGRTGRAGRKGVSISIIGPRDRRNVTFLERQVGKQFIQQQVPGGEEIIGQQLLKYMDKLASVAVDEERITPFVEMVKAQMEHMDYDTLLKHVISMEFNRFIDFYKHSKDLNQDLAGSKRERPERDRPERGPRAEREGNGERNREFNERPSRRRAGPKSFSRFFINLGQKNNLNPPKLISMINSMGGMRDADIGRIEIMKKFSFFEIDSAYSDDIMGELNGSEFQGVDILVEPADIGKHKERPAKPEGKFKKKFGNEEGGKKRFYEPFAKGPEKDKGKKDRKKPAFADKTKGTRKVRKEA